MVYIMKIYVDGGCRRNGHDKAIGAAACVVEKKWGKDSTWTRRLPTPNYWSNHPIPTSQRAEITAIILALEKVLDEYDHLRGYPRMMVTIYTDSKYAHGCMTDWIYKWTGNGWMNAAGNPVANQDIIREANDLDDKVKGLGTVEYIWIPRSGNQAADEAVADELNDMEDEGL